VVGVAGDKIALARPNSSQKIDKGATPLVPVGIWAERVKDDDPCESFNKLVAFGLITSPDDFPDGPVNRPQIFLHPLIPGLSQEYNLDLSAFLDPLFGVLHNLCRGRCSFLWLAFLETLRFLSSLSSW
jgi:hypothetical protein